MIYTITLNPALDKTVVIPSFGIDQVNRVAQVRLDPGGKGINVSKMIASLGGTSVAVAALSGAAGERWKQLAEGCGFEIHAIPAMGETRTNLKVVDPVGHTNTDINEPGAPIEDAVMEDLICWLEETLLPGDILVMSGSVPAGVDPGIYGRLTSLCHKRQSRAIVDADGPLLRAALAAGPTLIKPNHHELAAYAGHALYSKEEQLQVVRKLLHDGAQMVLVSLGPDGAMLCWQEDGVFYYCEVRSPEVTVASTVGAGDSMVGTVAYGMEQGVSREELLYLAVAAGTAAVTCDGSQAPGRDQVETIYPLISGGKSCILSKGSDSL